MVAGKTVLKEICFTYFVCNKHVVAKENELFRKIGESVNVDFDSVRIEDGNVFWIEKVILVNAFQFGMALVEPRRKMPGRHKMDLTNPRGILFDTAKPVL